MQDINPEWLVKGTKGYTPKPKPAPKGRPVLKLPEASMYAVKKTPQRWANFLVLIADERMRKRRYHLAWDGERLAETVELAMIDERHPGLSRKVEAFLAAQPFERFNTRRKKKPRRQWRNRSGGEA